MERCKVFSTMGLTLLLPLLPLGGGCAEDDAVAAQGKSMVCGEGTIEQQGQCVPDPAYLDRMLQPQVEAVKVASLVIQEEGERPLYVLHPFHASTTLEVTGRDEFSTQVVLGLEAPDGSKRCIAGQWKLDFVPAPEGADGTAPASTTFDLATEMLLQPGCEALASRDDVVAWLAFDPFGHVALAGRTLREPTEEDAADIAGFLQQSRLELAGCQASADGPHPESCVTALEIEASPGKDLVMTDLTLGSTVTVLERILPIGAAPPDETTVGPDGEVVEHGELDVEELSRPADRSPHFSVVSRLAAYGLDPDDDEQLEGGDVTLTFAIRPKENDQTRSLGLTAEELGWLPLSSMLQMQGRAGEEPTLEWLEEAFTESIVSTTILDKASPIYITGDAQFFMTFGPWQRLTQFELKVCAEVGFEEAGVEEDASENNCQTRTVYVVRNLEGPSEVAADPGDAVIHSDFAGWDETLRAGDWGVRMFLGATLRSHTNAAEVEGSAGVENAGTFPAVTDYMRVGSWGRDFYPASWTDKLRRFATVFDIDVAGYIYYWTQGSDRDWFAATREYSSRFPQDLCASYDLVPGILGVEACTAIWGEFHQEMSYEKQTVDSQCTASSPVLNGQCYVAYAQEKTHRHAHLACMELGGSLAAPTTQTMVDKITEARIAGGVTRGVWVDGYSYCGTPNFWQTLINTDYTSDPERSWALDYKRACDTQYPQKSNWMFNDFGGSLNDGNAQWANGEPSESNTVYGDDKLLLGSAGKLNTRNDAELWPYVCVFPQLSGTMVRTTDNNELSLLVKTYVYGGISVVFGAAAVGPASELILAELDFPIRAKITWNKEGTTKRTLASGVTSMDLRMLDGSFGISWSMLWGVSSGTYWILSWDGLEFTNLAAAKLEGVSHTY